MRDRENVRSDGYFSQVFTCVICSFLYRDLAHSYTGIISTPDKKFRHLFYRLQISFLFTSLFFSTVDLKKTQFMRIAYNQSITRHCFLVTHMAASALYRNQYCLRFFLRNRLFLGRKSLPYTHVINNSRAK